MTKKGQLRVWWSNRVPIVGKCEEYFVKDVDEAKNKLTGLTNRDLADKSCTDNVGGLTVYVGTDVDYETDNGWEEWYSDEGKDIFEVIER